MIRSTKRCDTLIKLAQISKSSMKDHDWMLLINFGLSISASQYKAIKYNIELPISNQTAFQK
jgi:hypothetical protein